MMFIVHERDGIYAKVLGRRSALEEGEADTRGGADGEVKEHSTIL
jgi:hypothetical protein